MSTNPYLYMSLRREGTQPGGKWKKKTEQSLVLRAFFFKKKPAVLSRLCSEIKKLIIPHTCIRLYPRKKILHWFKWGILRVLMSICEAKFLVRSADSKSKVTRTSTCQQFVVSKSAHNVLFIGNFVSLILDAFVTRHMQSLNKVNIQPVLLHRQNWDTVWFFCHPYQATVWIQFLGLVCAAFLCVVFRYVLSWKEAGYSMPYITAIFQICKSAVFDSERGRFECLLTQGVSPRRIEAEDTVSQLGRKE